MVEDWRPKLAGIDDPVAEDLWEFRTDDGGTKRVRVVVGRPKPIPDDQNGDWYCPVLIEGRTVGVYPVGGVGPVDSLMNAMNYISKFFNEVRPRPRAGP